MKKYYLAIPVILLLLMYIPPTMVKAQTDTSATIPTSTTAAQRKTDIQTQKMENLKNRANQEIDRRITSLTKLLERINLLKRLSSDQKTSFASRVQNEIANLTTLKTSIQSDATLETLRINTQSIVKSHRIYAFFIPQIQILVASDALTHSTDQATELATKLQSRIQEAQSLGKDVTSLTATLTDMTTKIADAKQQASNAATAVTNLTLEGFPGNKTQLQSARAMIVLGKKDLTEARQAAKTIVNTLKSTNSATP